MDISFVFFFLFLPGTHKREREKNEAGNFADTLSPFPKPEGEKNFALVSLAQRLLENKVEDEE